MDIKKIEYEKNIEFLKKENISEIAFIQKVLIYTLIYIDFKNPEIHVLQNLNTIKKHLLDLSKKEFPQDQIDTINNHLQNIADLIQKSKS